MLQLEPVVPNPGTGLVIVVYQVGPACSPHKRQSCFAQIIRHKCVPAFNQAILCIPGAKCDCHVLPAVSCFGITRRTLFAEAVSARQNRPPETRCQNNLHCPAKHPQSDECNLGPLGSTPDRIRVQPYSVRAGHLVRHPLVGGITKDSALHRGRTRWGPCTLVGDYRRCE